VSDPGVYPENRWVEFSTPADAKKAKHLCENVQEYWRKENAVLAVKLSGLYEEVERALRMLRDQNQLSAEAYEQKYYTNAGPLAPLEMIQRALRRVRP